MTDIFFVLNTFWTMCEIQLGKHGHLTPVLKWLHDAEWANVGLLNGRGLLLCIVWFDCSM